ncbi:Ameloblastin, partial [Pteropus alecto]
IKMKDLILILCLLEMSYAVPVFPQQSGTPGMASLSLETMRQLSTLQGLNTLSQYEYSLPVHPPPLPSQPSLQPQQPGQKPFFQPTLVTAMQATAQKGGPQPPVYQGQPPLQQAEGPMIEQQVAPSDKPSKAENTPARLGIMSSEEMAGGRGGPMAYEVMFPGFGGMSPSLGGMPHHPGMGGDFTLEFDTPVAGTKGPEKGEGDAQGSPTPEAHPANPENPALPPEGVPGALRGLLALPKGSVSGLARGPAGQSVGLPKVTPATADPLMTPELADAYENYGADTTTPLGETTMDTTVTPDTQQTSRPGNKAQQPHVWHFQEP